MVKTRMGLLDLRVQTAKVNATLCGARVINVYDAGRTYVLKLSVPPKRGQQNGSSSSTSISSGLSAHSSWEKRLLLIESGVRVHMTQYDREKDIPSGFCIKLRKHIRTRRLEYVRQLGDGGDRILDLVFSGEGSVCAHLIVEVFSGGNVVLTDADYTILTLLRTYRLVGSETDSTRVAVRERYPVENARSFSRLQLDQFITAGKRAQASTPDVASFSKISGRTARRKLYLRGVARKALAVELAMEPTLIEHALVSVGFAADTSLEELCANDCSGLRSVYKSLTDIETLLSQEMAHGEMKGFIITTVIDRPSGQRERFDEFVPYLFAQYHNRTYKEFESFDEAADEFFAHLEGERVEATQAKREAAAYKKVDKLELELKGQVSAFENARDKSLEMAQAIESNIIEVEAAITVIRSAIAAAVPWDGLAEMVQDEKRNGNPVAEIIHSLQLDKNQVILMLEDTFGSDDEDEVDDLNDNDDDDDVHEDEDDGDDSEVENLPGEEKRKPQKKYIYSSPESRKALLVPVDISLTAHANARRYYEMRKSAAAKMEKAAEAKDRTIKAASKKAASEAQKLEEEAVAASIRARRKAFWFEKFYWFVSSENYLIVAGRDAQQNELLVKRYLGPADVYVYADLEGASSVIVKNQRRLGLANYTDIPQMTLEQAGTFAMCRSTAWESKIVTSAWWVRASQVSKTTSAGQYLSAGNFAIRGKKNFLNPTQLIMGLGFLFKVDEANAENHKDERNVREFNDSTDMKKDDESLKFEQLSLTSVSEGKSYGQRNNQMEISLDIPKPAQSNESVKDSCKSNRTADSSAAMYDRLGNTRIEEDTSIKETLSSHVLQDNDQFEHDQKYDKGYGSAKEGSEVPSTGNSSEQYSKGRGKDKGEVKSKVGNALPRGKKHKLKKMKKYSDQDEDERRIALAVLGSKPIKEETTVQFLDNERSQGDSAEDDVNGVSGEGGREDTKTKRLPRESRQEELLLMDEEGVIELEKLESGTTAALSLLTANPTVGDTIEFGLPVCAPLYALSQYRYRVKLMPGSMKRGKAYRAAVVLFQKQAEKDLGTFKQERDAIRLTPESDGIHGMLSNVKIMAPGLANAQKALSKAKKASVSVKKSKQK